MSEEVTGPSMAEDASPENVRLEVMRHTWVDRAFHWLMAAAIFVLLGTSFLPIWGLQFAWVVPHWIAGAVLIVLVLFHIVRASFFQRLRDMLIGPRDVSVGLARWRAYRAGMEGPKPGKYTLAQRLYHLAVTILVLAACITGGLMMVKQDTPLWKRDPYWLADNDWGIVYVVHGLSAIAILAILLIHIYFALRPEKLFYTRSMIRGRITGREYADHHDPARWPGEGA